MSSLLYQIVTSTTLLTLSLYHLTSTTITYLKSPTTFTSKPYHPLPLSPTRHHTLRHLPLYITLTFLALTSLFSLISSLTPSPPDPLFPLHPLSLLLSSLYSFLFLLLALPLFSPSLLPIDLHFSLFSAAFALLSLPFPSPPSSIESHCHDISSRISSLSAVFSLALALNPKLFIADVLLSASVALQGLWVLQTGLSLHVDAFIPNGCHRLLDVVSGVEGSTKCDLDESKMRAVAVLDVAFVVHVIVVVVMVMVVYCVVSKLVGGSMRRLGSYEALPNTTENVGVVVGGGSNSVVQMKTLTGTQA